jgi:hypothetical protein
MRPNRRRNAFCETENYRTRHARACPPSLKLRRTSTEGPSKPRRRRVPGLHVSSAEQQDAAGRNYFVATWARCAARSRSITVRQPTLSLARCLIMHAVIAGTLGISELHRRNASPLHICCASALKAKLALDDSAEQETAKASTKPARRIVLVRDAVIFGSHGPARRGALLMGGDCLSRITPTVMSLT